MEHPGSYWNLSGLRIWTQASMKNETHIKSYKIEAIQVWKKIIKPQTFPRVPPSFRYFVSSCNSFLRLLWLLASPRFNVFEKTWRGVCLVETGLQPTKFVQQCVGLCHHALVPWIFFFKCQRHRVVPNFWISDSIRMPIRLCGNTSQKPRLIDDFDYRKNVVGRNMSSRPKC